MASQQFLDRPPAANRLPELRGVALLSIWSPYAAVRRGVLQRPRPPRTIWRSCKGCHPGETYATSNPDGTCGRPVLACSAAQSPEGRWEGVILIPDRELPFVVDLARDHGGAWAGSIIIPGLGIKGAALSNIAVTDTGMTFAVAGSLASTKHGPASFVARLAQDSIAGQMSQAGNTAEFLLRRMGPAQVEPPPRSTPVRADLEDRWTGEFELGGYPRHVTITFENRADTGATARFVIVGKQTTLVPVDLVIQDGDFVKLESATTRITFEGRYVRDTGQIRGVIELGAIELPLVLRRAAGSAS